RIAKFMEETWPNDSPTDMARHQLGSLLAMEGDWLGALEAYARVTPAYANLAYLRHEQGMACYRLQLAPEDRKGITPEVKKQWFDRIVAELERMPDLAQAADAGSANAYCLARLQLGYLYHLNGGKYKQAEDIAKSLLEQVPKYVSLDDRQRAELMQQSQALRLASLYGEVFERVKVGEHGKAAALYMPVVEDL